MWIGYLSVPNLVCIKHTMVSSMLIMITALLTASHSDKPTDTKLLSSLWHGVLCTGPDMELAAIVPV